VYRKSSFPRFLTGKGLLLHDEHVLSPMRIAALTLLCLVLLPLKAQVPPQIHGTAVSGRAHVLPDELKGRVAVLVLGFTRNSSLPAGAWAGKFKADFSRNPDVAVLQLPFLEEVPRMFRGMAKSGVEKSAGQDRDTVIPIFESEATFKQLVHYAKPDDAYILVLDRTGAIRGVFSGQVATQYADARERVSHLLLKPSVAPMP
jgi:hypothetical protein